MAGGRRGLAHAPQLSAHTGKGAWPRPVSKDSPIEHIPPVRGLITATNRKGARLGVPDLERWLRLNRVVFKTPKIDVLARGAAYDALPALFDTARSLDTRLSLRTDCTAPPPADLKHWRDVGALLDVFLCPPRIDAARLDEWFSACREAELPIRLQVTAPFEKDLDVQALAGRVADAGAVAVNVALHDPFITSTKVETQEPSLIEQLNDLAEALVARGVNTRLLNLPFCLVREGSRPVAQNSAQFFLDHQHYARESYELAAKLYQRGPVWAGKSITMLLGRHTSYPNPIDGKLLPWLLDHPWVRARIWAWHKLTRHLKLPRTAPRAAGSTLEDCERELKRFKARQRKELGPACAGCSLKRICDCDTPELRRILPGANLSSQAGEDIADPMRFAGDWPRYNDPIDRARLEQSGIDDALAAGGNAILTHQPPDREVDSFDYKAEGDWSWQLAGSVRWFSYTNTEKISTPLATLQPPFTLAATFGGGIAEYVGFSLGTQARVVCPMVAFSHQVALHVAEDGRYVLLRDGVPVRPVEFAGDCYVPTRLGSVVEPRLSLWNIDGTLGTQGVLLWEREQERAALPPATNVTYSVVIACTRYARRLQACLRCIAHQESIGLDRIEVIVAFVPGMDATGDVLDAIRHAHPGLRVLRSPFPAERALAKGALINQSLPMASGEWVMLLDADTLIAPDMFARIDAVSEDAHFVVPDGRKMLTPETTASILLGDVEPWRAWKELLEGPGEFRLREAEGVPVGFCQCVRASCLESVQYEEHGHFEGADWKFAQDIRERFGRETRVSGAPVLHLDHGPSNWYGAPRHY
jgi:Glycosyl transferase family 2